MQRTPLGAVPAVVRHDNLSAATHELKRSGRRQLTERFRGVLDHYGLDSTRSALKQWCSDNDIEVIETQDRSSA